MIAGVDDLLVGRWSARFRGRRFACATGRGGIGVKRREGDAVTPAGRFALEAVLYRPDRVRFRGGVMRMGLGWSDDAADPCYNEPVRLPHGFSHERLWRGDGLYDLVGVLDYNRDPVARGAGSCIFLHVWRRPRFPTEGCIAFALADLRWILSRWQSGARVVVQA